ncbi:MAG: glycosyltransferase [Candidatus Micrarchaeota archaeon]
MAKPKVSVIVPERNGSEYILDTLRSIKNQDFEDFECLILDNKSTDDTVAKIRGFILGDARFRLIEHERNIGYVGNLNAGLREAEGKYIAYLHADDLWDEKFLSSSVALLEKNPGAGMSFCRFRNIGSDGRAHKIPAINAYSGESRAISARELFSEYIKRDITPVCTVMVRMKVQDEVGEYDPQYPGPCDYQMWLKIVYKWGGAYNSESTSSYRIHGSSGTGLIYDRGILLTEQYSMIHKLFDSFVEKNALNEKLRAKMLETTAWASLRQAVRAVSQNKGDVCRGKCGIALACYPSVKIVFLADVLFLASYFTFIIWPLAKVAVDKAMKVKRN